MKENIIYVAGNPDAYPVEYYDKESGTYCGVLPELFAEFSEKSTYKIEYYNPGKKDHRKELAENLQVDLISGCVGKESFLHKDGGEIVSFQATKNGEAVVYRILVSENAPLNLAKDLKAFLDEVSHEEEIGLVIESAEKHFQSENHSFGMIVLGCCLAFLIIIGFILSRFKKYKKKITKLERIREIDEVTGIGNKEHFMRYYKMIVNDKNRILYSVLYFYIDVDRIERVSNPKGLRLFLGHMASILQEYTSDYDLLARVSDGGFVLLHQMISIEETEEWLLPALERIRTFFGQQNIPEAYNVSTGIYQMKNDDKDINECIFNAAQCAQSAYKAGEKYRVCTNEMMKKFMEERKLQGQIERALEQDEFELYMQFYIDANSHKIVGGEALSRWNHPEKGRLSPKQFIPMMEKEGVVSELDYFSLKKSCEFLEKLSRMGIENFFVSCNFSRWTISSEEFSGRCVKIMDSYKFNHRHLIFEITESVVEKHPESVRYNIQKIKEMGIRIALDDFGNGFTSFLDIYDLPLDTIKLDKSLIDRIGTKTGNVILKSMIEVGHELGIQVLAEGVENDMQVQNLKNMHCDIIQGFHFYYPIPEWEAIRKLLECLKEKKD